MNLLKRKEIKRKKQRNRIVKLFDKQCKKI